MTTYNTGNAIGSTDARDLLDNAQALDEAINSTSQTYTDRRGVQRRTLPSLQAEFPNASANAVAAAAAAVAAADSAVDAANEATSAATAVGLAFNEATAAQVARVAAEAARDAALIQAGVYVDEPTGRAAVADDVAFKVQGSGDVAAYEYRRINSTTSEPIATYPSAARVDGISKAVSLVDAGLNGGTFAAFDEAKTSTLSSPNTILLGTPIAIDCEISQVKVRVMQSLPVNIVIAAKDGFGQYTLVSSIPIIPAAGVSTHQVSISAQKGQYIGLRGLIAIGTDTAIKNQPYLRFGTPISSTPQAPAFTNSDAQIAISYKTLDIVDAIGELRNGAGIQIGTGSQLPATRRDDNTDTKTPLFIADTFGTNQALHPTVMHFPAGFNGYAYVMVQTPYPRSTMPLYIDRYECPTIHYSQDGISWTAGVLMDDLTEAEIANRDYFSDPELVFNTGTSQLEVWYRITRGLTNPGTALLRRIINSDGTFGARQILLTAEQMAASHLVRSPALIYEDGKYKMWFTGFTGGNIGYGETSDPTNPAGWTWQPVSLGAGATNCWHLDVVKLGGTYYLFNNTVLFDLHLHTATTTTSFTKVKEVLVRTFNRRDFYGEVVYRSTALVVGSGYMLYVSGWNAPDANAVSSIGLMRGTSFENLSLVDGGFKRNDLRIGGNIRLANTALSRSVIELDDRGNALGFDYATKTVYFQRSTGERIKISQ